MKRISNKVPPCELSINILCKLSFTFLLTALANNLYALPQADSVPGGIALVALDLNAEETAVTPYVAFNKQRVMVHRQNKQWLAVVGIPLHTKPGQHEINVSIQNRKTYTIAFEVKNKDYKNQYITLKNKRQVNPNTMDLSRINKEKKQMKAVFTTWRAQKEDLAPFIKPAQGPYSSPFGLRRFFNQQARKPHSGVDIAAPAGTKIIAPADGIISASGDYFFNGKTVLLDHGQGLISMFCHMDTIRVKPGQLIKRGELLGTVGQTGRATGPHLHWSLSLNNARINPILFLTQQ